MVRNNPLFQCVPVFEPKIHTFYPSISLCQRQEVVVKIAGYSTKSLRNSSTRNERKVRNIRERPWIPFLDISHYKKLWDLFQSFPFPARSSHWRDLPIRWSVRSPWSVLSLCHSALPWPHRKYQPSTHFTALLYNMCSFSCKSKARRILSSKRRKKSVRWENLSECFWKTIYNMVISPNFHRFSERGRSAKEMPFHLWFTHLSHIFFFKLMNS